MRTLSGVMEMLYLDLGVGYPGVYDYQTRRILLYVNYTSVKKIRQNRSWVKDGTAPWKCCLEQASEGDPQTVAGSKAIQGGVLWVSGRAMLAMGGKARNCGLRS